MLPAGFADNDGSGFWKPARGAVLRDRFDAAILEAQAPQPGWHGGEIASAETTKTFAAVLVFVETL